MGPNKASPVPSSSSSWWWGSPAEKYRTKRINIHLGQVVTSWCLSWGRQVWCCLLQDCGSVASFCIMCSVLLEGFRDESGGNSGAFDGLQHLLCYPFTCMSCGCGLPRVGGWFHSRASSCNGGWVFTVSGQRLLHTPKTLLLPTLLWGACASLAAGKPVPVGSIPKLLGLILLWKCPPSLINYFADMLKVSVSFSYLE